MHALGLEYVTHVPNGNLADVKELLQEPKMIRNDAAPEAARRPMAYGSGAGRPVWLGGWPARALGHRNPWTEARFALVVTTTSEILPGFHVLTTRSGKPGTLEMSEVSFAVRTPKGLVVLVGCAHPGVENILAQAAALDPRLHTVLGGFHLVLTQRDEVERVADVLHRELKIERVGGPLHERAGVCDPLDRFKERFEEAALVR